MKFFGYDPGTIDVGWGVVTGDGKVGSYGGISAPAKWRPERRLAKIYPELLEVLQAESPDIMVTEELFVYKNETSAIRTGEGRGIGMLAAGQMGIPVLEINPKTIKKCVTGSGRSSKETVRGILGSLLNIPTLTLPLDVSDALAIAYTLMHRLEALRRVDKAEYETIKEILKLHPRLRTYSLRVKKKATFPKARGLKGDTKKEREIILKRIAAARRRKY